MVFKPSRQYPVDTPRLLDRPRSTKQGSFSILSSLRGYILRSLLSYKNKALRADMRAQKPLTNAKKDPRLAGDSLYFEGPRTWILLLHSATLGEELTI